jgi:hypothetical protein
VDLIDNIGIGTAAPNEQLEITGNFRPLASTATTGLIMSDGNRFIHNFGTNNFFAGANAGNLTMIGICCNTGGGVDALTKNTTGFSNTAVGQSALSNTTTGAGDTVIGQGARQFNTKGIQNTATVVAAIFSNTTGSDNTVARFSALLANTAGSNNTAVEFGADVSSSNLTNAIAIGNGGLVNARNKIHLGNGSVTVLGTVADVFVEAQGLGIILRDTDGAGCHGMKANSAGTLIAAVLTCP